MQIAEITNKIKIKTFLSKQN